MTKLSLEGEEMDLDIVSTIGGNVFRIDDVSDEAPMLKLEFFNEFAALHPDKKKRIADKALTAALEEILK